MKVKWILHAEYSTVHKYRYYAVGVNVEKEVEAKVVIIAAVQYSTVQYISTGTVGRINVEKEVKAKVVIFLGSIVCRTLSNISH